MFLLLPFQIIMNGRNSANIGQHHTLDNPGRRIRLNLMIIRSVFLRPIYGPYHSTWEVLVSLFSVHQLLSDSDCKLFDLYLSTSAQLRAVLQIFSFEFNDENKSYICCLDRELFHFYFATGEHGTEDVHPFTFLHLLIYVRACGILCLLQDIIVNTSISRHRPFSQISHLDRFTISLSLFVFFHV